MSEGACFKAIFCIEGFDAHLAIGVDDDAWASEDSNAVSDVISSEKIYCLKAFVFPMYMSMMVHEFIAEVRGDMIEPCSKCPRADSIAERYSGIVVSILQAR